MSYIASTLNKGNRHELNGEVTLTADAKGEQVSPSVYSSSSVASFLSPGIWLVDSVRSRIVFSVRHMAVSKVRGELQRFSAIIHIDEEPEQSRLEAVMQMDSLYTNDDVRDNYLKNELLKVELFPTARFSSTLLTSFPDHYLVQGELTIKDTTRPCTLEVIAQRVLDPSKKDLTTASFKATARIRRSEFGLSFEPAIELGGIVVSDVVELAIEAAAFKHMDNVWRDGIQQLN